MSGFPDTLACQTAAAKTADLILRYHEPEKFLPLCEACENYGKNHACPPTGMDMRAHFLSFPYAHLFAAQVPLDENASKPTSRAAFARAKREFDERLIRLEKTNEGSLAAAPGCCMLCARCARADGLPCVSPEKLRLSIDAYSLNVTALAKDFFGIDLAWYKEKPPAHYTLIGVLLCGTPSLKV